VHLLTPVNAHAGTRVDGARSMSDSKTGAKTSLSLRMSAVAAALPNVPLPIVQMIDAYNARPSTAALLAQMTAAVLPRQPPALFTLCGSQFFSFESAVRLKFVSRYYSRRMQLVTASMAAAAAPDSFLTKLWVGMHDILPDPTDPEALCLLWRDGSDDTALIVYAVILAVPPGLRAAVGSQPGHWPLPASGQMAISELPDEGEDVPNPLCGWYFRYYQPHESRRCAVM
jgi:hypothetical protein